LLLAFACDFQHFASHSSWIKHAMDAKPDRSSLRVVVVDDNYDANFGIAKLLERSGFEVAGRAYDGLAGLNLIKSTHPDVAILDIAMPALDGYELARRIHRELDSPPRLVALTGFGQDSDKAVAAEAGFDAYFRKPADWSAMESLLAKYARE
jgi:CheY-like chemotaxis protein